jgi:hypothetical protein
MRIGRIICHNHEISIELTVKPEFASNKYLLERLAVRSKSPRQETGAGYGPKDLIHGGSLLTINLFHQGDHQLQDRQLVAVCIHIDHVRRYLQVNSLVADSFDHADQAVDLPGA